MERTIGVAGIVNALPARTSTSRACAFARVAWASVPIVQQRFVVIEITPAGLQRRPHGERLTVVEIVAAGFELRSDLLVLSLLPAM
jgi:hypothetical protein